MPIPAPDEAIAATNKANPTIPTASQYTRLERMGHGSFDNQSNELVAIKVINLENNWDAEDIDEVRHEISLLAHCSHPNIVQYRASFTVGTSLWTVMEYCALGSLRQLLDRIGSLEETVVIVIAKEIIAALLYLHEHGIAHRDIKAANILLTSDGRIKLGDFGVASHRPLWHGIGVGQKTDLQFVGSPYWMAPELINHINIRAGRNVDARALAATDIWSLGITLVELLTGQPPLAHLEPSRAISLIATSAPPRLDPVRFGEQIRLLVEACLHDDPSKRPTAKQLSSMKCFLELRKSRSNLASLLELAGNSNVFETMRAPRKFDCIENDGDKDETATLATIASGWTFGTFHSEDIQPLQRDSLNSDEEEKNFYIETQAKKEETTVINSNITKRQVNEDEDCERTITTPRSLRYRTFSAQSIGSDSTGPSIVYTMAHSPAPSLPTWEEGRPPSILQFSSDGSDGEEAKPELLLQKLFAQCNFNQPNCQKPIAVHDKTVAAVHRLRQVGSTMPEIRSPFLDRLELKKLIKDHSEFLKGYQEALQEAEQVLWQLENQPDL